MNTTCDSVFIRSGKSEGEHNAYDERVCGGELEVVSHQKGNEQIVKVLIKCKVCGASYHKKIDLNYVADICWEI